MIFVAIGFCLIAQAGAQSTLNIRSGAHDGYSRLVFDWATPTTYNITKSSGVLSVSFDKAATADLTKINQENLENIGPISEISSDGQSLALEIQIKPNSRFRDFQIGNRVVLDVYDSQGEIQRNQAMPEVKPAAEPKPQTSAPSDETLEDTEMTNEDLPEIKSLGGIEPHIITLTSTQSVGLSAFQRAGFLWLVFDNPNLRTAPILAGPQKDKLPKLEKIEVEGASAYRMPIPEGYYFYGEGGGLLWRIVMTPNPRRVNPIRPIVEKPNLQELRGGTLLWPFKSPRQTITLIDPLVGDEITVVTTEGSEDFAGLRRQYISLEVLPSVVGLAIVPKADDVSVSKVSNGVQVTRPNGLALSSPKDAALAKLKDDIKKEEEFFTEEEKTERLSLIFDFKRWEMGGFQALERNRQILMRSIGAKKGSARAEDLITLAKLNLANNKGQEALGLLKVAAQELPGIEENPEYIALRGAAGTLAGKFDEAIRDLSVVALRPYTEKNYWRAVTLAGLEDWQQADAVMPTDFDVLMEYPMSIQKPLTLSMAEVSLRAGKTLQAERLLSNLEPEFPTMTLAEQSAWKYLNGEFEHQKDRPDRAIENWQPLITGDDDYYRAKAGLSLTRLQLERQKITPAKAIDRLEGLRYAWRGDELETLINYRLGQVYVKNGDYLKGLSVLRNAISLSPDLPLTREVTEYMTETFRRIFTDGTLNNMSPIDAISIYDEFKELTPLGAEGDVFVQNLAERLVDIDLLGRASGLLQYQLDHRVSGGAAVNVALRLAAIQLIDGKAEEALQSLATAEANLNALSGSEQMKKSREVKLLKARALSKSNRANEGLSLLRGISDREDVNRLRADIAWNAGQWGPAATAFGNLIAGQNISLTRPADEYETNLIINQAIALNLSGNRTGLSSLRERYQDLMTQTDKAKIFDLVTRPRQLGVLNNDSSVRSLISEVDLFGEFLENYKSTQ